MDIKGIKIVSDDAFEDGGVLGDDSQATSQIVKAPIVETSSPSTLKNC
jgi:hypothetical protein